jgi:hypothetical protein
VRFKDQTISFAVAGVTRQSILLLERWMPGPGPGMTGMTGLISTER